MPNGSQITREALASNVIIQNRNAHCNSASLRTSEEEKKRSVD
uniref:Uncharacterized protein n=1 Tax=Rhizophora mucronata TaxID=61149 RepID=A0A2P2PY87_RHIMU